MKTKEKVKSTVESKAELRKQIKQLAKERFDFATQLDAANAARAQLLRQCDGVRAAHVDQQFEITELKHQIATQHVMLANKAEDLSDVTAQAIDNLEKYNLLNNRYKTMAWDFLEIQGELEQLKDNNKRGFWAWVRIITKL